MSGVILHASSYLFGCKESAIFLQSIELLELIVFSVSVIGEDNPMFEASMREYDGNVHTHDVRIVSQYILFSPVSSHSTQRNFFLHVIYFFLKFRKCMSRQSMMELEHRCPSCMKIDAKHSFIRM